MNKNTEDIADHLKKRGATVEDLARMTLSKIKVLTSYPRFAYLFTEVFDRGEAMENPEIMDSKIVKDMMVKVIAAASGLAAMIGDDFEFGGFNDDGWESGLQDTYPAIQWFIAGKIGADAAEEIISTVKEATA